MRAASCCDVLVCGLGPVGQLLALLLGLRGVSVIAIDKAAGPYDLPRAAVVDDEVLRIFQAAGVVEEVLEQSQPQSEVSFVTERGRPITILRPVDGCHGHHPLVSVHQPSLERVLLRAMGTQASVETRWRARLERLDRSDDGVEALVSRGDGVEPEAIGARWAVGCDGAASRVRRVLGIEFGGSTFRQRWLVVDARVDRPLASVRHPHFIGDPGRPIVCLPMSPGRHRWEWMLHPGEREEPFLEPGWIRARVDTWLDGERATVERAVVYTFHARVAARWRTGRVLLAGDAAHLMPPFAGQGFSSGARDAFNLAWKLEAVMRGAPEALLDSYEAERRPHVRAMTRLTLANGRIVQTTNRGVALLRDALLTGLDQTGLAAAVRERIKPLPAYRSGAFAERPARLPFKRVVGSQFPQPAVRDRAGRRRPFDEVAGPGWVAIARERVPDALAGEGLRMLTPGRDFEDPPDGVSEWLDRNACDWAILRPDRFVFALGSGDREARSAADQLRRCLGRAARQAPAVAGG